jgi:DNA-binding response OmpR family regulator
VVTSNNEGMSEHFVIPGPILPATRRVLVVDDEQPLARLLGTYLERDGFEVTLAFDGVAAVESARAVDPDVVVLDLGLPGLDGLEVCRQVRTFSDCYIVMLTARSEEVDKLVGLSSGADDYVTKPFSPRELVARVHVMLRRPRVSGGPDPVAREPAVVFGPLTIDTMGREVHLAEDVIDLTRTEFDLLAALAARPRMAFSRRQLIEAVWGGELGGRRAPGRRPCRACAAQTGRRRRGPPVHQDGTRDRVPDGRRHVNRTREPGRRWGLSARLLTAQVLVVVTGVLTAWLVATAIAPGLFRMHMREAGPRSPPKRPCTRRRPSGRPARCP